LPEQLLRNSCRHFQISRKSAARWPNMIIETYAMESCLARTQKLVASRGDAAKLAIAMTQVYLTQSMEKVEAPRRKSPPLC